MNFFYSFFAALIIISPFLVYAAEPLPSNPPLGLVVPAVTANRLEKIELLLRKTQVLADFMDQESRAISGVKSIPSISIDTEFITEVYGNLSRAETEVLSLIDELTSVRGERVIGIGNTTAQNSRFLSQPSELAPHIIIRGPDGIARSSPVFNTGALPPNDRGLELKNLRLSGVTGKASNVVKANEKQLEYLQRALARIHESKTRIKMILEFFLNNGIMTPEILNLANSYGATNDQLRQAQEYANQFTRETQMRPRFGVEPVGGGVPDAVSPVDSPAFSQAGSYQRALSDGGGPETRTWYSQNKILPKEYSSPDPFDNPFDNGARGTRFLTRGQDSEPCLLVGNPDNQTPVTKVTKKKPNVVPQNTAIEAAKAESAVVGNTPITKLIFNGKNFVRLLLVGGVVVESFTYPGTYSEKAAAGGLFALETYLDPTSWFAAWTPNVMPLPYGRYIQQTGINRMSIGAGILSDPAKLDAAIAEAGRMIMEVESCQAKTRLTVNVEYESCLVTILDERRNTKETVLLSPSNYKSVKGPGKGGAGRVSIITEEEYEKKREGVMAKVNTYLSELYADLNDMTALRATMPDPQPVPDPYAPSPF